MTAHQTAELPPAAPPDSRVSPEPPPAGRQAGAVEHLVWLNQHAAFVGGVESYIHQAVEQFRRRGVRCTLLFDPNGATSTKFLNTFDAAFPMVETGRQLDALSADVAYVHRLSGRDAIRQLAASRTPVLRFFHDHKLFCLREHKYTTIGCQTCTRPTSLACYACLGFATRRENWPGVGVRRLGALRAEQRANQQLDGFVVGSRYMAKHVAAHGFPSERIHRVPLFATPAASGTPPTPAAPADQAAREPNLLLFAGTLVRGKGVDTLLRALAKTRIPAPLIIAGDGRQAPKFQKLSRELGLTDRVRFVGRLASGELRDYFARAQCLIMPSRSPETFGQSGLEALSHGVPVIGSDVGGMGEWLRHEQTGLTVPANDVDALTQAIDRMLSDHEFRRACGERGRKVQQKEFTAELHLDRLTRLFHSVVRR